MTPLEISILLHYRVSPTDYRDGDFSAPAVREIIDGFVDANLIVAADESSNDGPLYVIAERGVAYIEALRRVQLPVCRRVVPS